MLRFGLVSFPVQAFNAHGGDHGHVAFHQLHAECHSRIHYEKVCPIHGPVKNDDIVLGYEYQKGKYVEIDPEEVNELRTEAERALTIDAFIEPDEFDPIYFDGRMYYLVPDGASAKEPYAIFLRALEHEHRYGIGQVVLSGRQQAVLVRARDGVLHMALLYYAAAIQQKPAALSELPRLNASDKKLALAEKLIDGWGEADFDYSQYVDQYETEIKKLITAKMHGKQLVAPAEEEEPPVYNLMDALRKSMARHNGHAGRPTRTVAHKSSNGRRGIKPRSAKRPARRRQAS